MRWVLLISLFLLFAFRLALLPHSDFVSGTKLKITGTLKEEPRITSGSQIFSLAGLKVQTYRYPEYHFGDRLEIVGIVKKDKEIDKVENIKLIGETEGIGSRLYEFRRKIEAVYKQSLPEPHASLLSGIILGTKSGMPKDFYDSLRTTGTMHIIVASGMNVVIVATTLLSLFLLFLDRRLATILCLIGIWFYVFLAGADIPVIRAGIMGSLVFLAQGLGRESDAWRGLIVSALVLLLIYPLNLVDLSFQLSFASTTGILYFSPKINSRLSRVPNIIKSDLSQTLGAQIATFPILFLNFGQISPLSPITNILIIGIIPTIMKIGAIGGLVGLFFPLLGKIVVWLVLPFLTYFVEVVRLFSKI